MSRSQQDQFIDDDEEETCPLCVEEFDLTDKGFRPCPCGYQICQFCYHNVKTNMNGLCPACRRPYDDKTIEYKVITPEETAAHRARQAQRQKKTQQALQKEKQKAEADHLSRKHLSGLRVVQKNLVYVTGLQPTTQEDQLLQTLRGEQYFGQYGKIIKIVVSKAKDPAHPSSVGVYVTYERKEDAHACIAAVNGSKNGDRTLRAQFGTTKYCSAYLRGETCMNRNCMFLHEPGEANESYSRADLSALNAGSSQQGDPRPAPPQSQQPMASASQPMARQSSSDRPSSPTADARPALPSHASWASKAPQLQPSRAESRSTSGTLDPPPIEEIAEQSAPQPHSATTAPQPAAPVETPQQPPQQPKPRTVHSANALLQMLKNLDASAFQFAFDTSLLPQPDLDALNNYPALFDNNGDARRRVRLEQEEERRREQEARAFQDPPAMDPEDNPEMSGSLQLGGEPEERPGAGRSAPIRSHGQEGILDQRFQFGGGVTSPGAGERVLTPQQQQQLLLQTMKSGGDPSSYVNQSSAFQSSVPQQGTSAPPGHQRNVSRYSFANDSSSASMSVKPVANQKLLNQQASIMPSSGSNFGAQQQGQSFFTSNVQGPPPGLKTTGTPPVSGGMTFGQGHGFATGGLQYGSAASRLNNPHEDHMRNLLRGPNADAASKHDIEFPPLGPPSRQLSVSLNESRRSTPPVPPGFEAHLGSESRRSTPTVPPGLTKPTALPQLDDDGQLSRPGSRPGSRASLRRQTSTHIVPALPLRPGTPARTGTPSLTQSESQEKREPEPHQTPTRPSRGLTKQAEVMAAKSAPVTSESVPKEDESVMGRAQPAEPKPLTDSSNKKEPKNDEKRKHPGKLDITAAVSQNEQPSSDKSSVADNGTLGKLPKNSILSAAVSTESPISSPLAKVAPRTLRVVPTPKAETPPPASAVSSSLPTPAAAALRFPSRQPSVASIQRPGTPSSEHVSMSDNISITSTSMSRANSPPPMGSKVGTAPLRTKTKNQMKKERQERAKALEGEKAMLDEGSKPPVEEPAQEAIVSRKKKAKKEKELKAKPKTPGATNAPTPSGSRPETPVSKTPADEVQIVEQPAATRVPTPAETTPHSPQPPREPSPQTSLPFDPAAMIQELKAAKPEIQRCLDSLFRTPTNHHLKPAQAISPKDLQGSAAWKSEFKINLTKDEVDALLKGAVPAVRYGGGEGRTWDRGLVTPSGAHIRALPEELEIRFLELEKAIRDMPDELRFHPSKPQNETKFPGIDLEALKRQYESCAGGGSRGVSVMEQMVQDGSNMKKGAFLVDEASKYINEFVMPPATPPPNTHGVKQRCAQHGGEPCHCAPQHQSGVTHTAQDASRNVFSPDLLDKQLQDLRKQSDDKDAQLKKAIKKNRKILGLG